MCFDLDGKIKKYNYCQLARGDHRGFLSKGYYQKHMVRAVLFSFSVRGFVQQSD
jgi:hypothetical protein